MSETMIELAKLQEERDACIRQLASLERSTMHKETATINRWRDSNDFGEFQIAHHSEKPSVVTVRDLVEPHALTIAWAAIPSLIATLQCAYDDIRVTQPAPELTDDRE